MFTSLCQTRDFQSLDRRFQAYLGHQTMNKGRHPMFLLILMILSAPNTVTQFPSNLLAVPVYPSSFPFFPRSLASCEAPMVTCGSKQGKRSAHKSPTVCVGAHFPWHTTAWQQTPTTNLFRCQTPCLKSRTTCVNLPCFSPPWPLRNKNPSRDVPDFLCFFQSLQRFASQPSVRPSSSPFARSQTCC